MMLEYSSTAGSVRKTLNSLVHLLFIIKFIIYLIIILLFNSSEMLCPLKLWTLNFSVILIKWAQIVAC